MRFIFSAPEPLRKIADGLRTMLGELIYGFYTIISALMFAYGANFYYLAFRSSRNVSKPAPGPLPLNSLPPVTIQLPIYNERYVARRIIETTCRVEYPRSQLEIQVLDDSSDETTRICKEAVQEFRDSGTNITYIHRPDRAGYKAGALREGLKTATGEFIAIFDADFLPPEDFLLKSLPYFATKEVGMVQTRWGHLNGDYSSLTKAQALSLDAHFLIEQRAKGYSELFMVFNGTSGIWRRDCITDSGGWNDSLAEDLDLSFRAQLRGWRFAFVDDQLSNGEVPVQMNASRRQQYRWAKGTAQCVRKFLLEIFDSPLNLGTKLQAVFQLTRHIVFPLSILQLLLLPFLIVWGFDLSPTTGIVSQLTLGPLAYVYAIRKMYGKNWAAMVPRYMYLLLFGEGISLSNSVGFFQGLLGQKGSFERTPKYGITSNRESWKGKSYPVPFSWMTSGEIALAAYGIVVILMALIKGTFLLIPSLAAQTLGFIYVSGLTFVHSWGSRGRVLL
jgi:cellulose synthase/poly-beta-1,6-N-acetylglucosamine synthase-like glycosyltransferase